MIFPHNLWAKRSHSLAVIFPENHSPNEPGGGDGARKKHELDEHFRFVNNLFDSVGTHLSADTHTDSQWMDMAPSGRQRKSTKKKLWVFAFWTGNDDLSMFPALVLSSSRLPREREPNLSQNISFSFWPVCHTSSAQLGLATCLSADFLSPLSISDWLWLPIVYLFFFYLLTLVESFYWPFGLTNDSFLLTKIPSEFQGSKRRRSRRRNWLFYHLFTRERVCGLLAWLGEEKERFSIVMEWKIHSRAMGIRRSKPIWGWVDERDDLHSLGEVK